MNDEIKQIFADYEEAASHRLEEQRRLIAVHQAKFDAILLEIGAMRVAKEEVLSIDGVATGGTLIKHTLVTPKGVFCGDTEKK